MLPQFPAVAGSDSLGHKTEKRGRVQDDNSHILSDRIQIS
jgi:hypothetical protein